MQSSNSDRKTRTSRREERKRRQKGLTIRDVYYVGWLIDRVLKWFGCL